jgi:hypothetical protein
MDVRASHTFDHPIEKVWAMFCDQDAHVAKFTGMGHRDIEVLDYSNDGAKVMIRVQRVVDVDLPGSAKKVLKPTSTVESTDHWNDNGDGTYGGTFVADAKGQPVDVKGTTRLSSTGDDQTRYEVTATVKVNVPLVGGKIEKWARGDIEKQMSEEFDAGDKWLAEH